MIKLAANLERLLRIKAGAPAPAPPTYIRNWTPQQLNRFQQNKNWRNSYIRKPSNLDNWSPPMRAPENFKVDEVGMSNDFRLVPPSSTLAVRG